MCATFLFILNECLWFLICFLSFLLVYISCGRCFVVTFPYMHTMYPSLCHLFHCSPSSPSPFIKWLWQVSMFHNHTCIESTSTIFTLIYPPPHSCPPLNVTCFMLQSLIVYCHSLLNGVWPWMLPVNALYFDRCNLLYCSSLPFPLPHIVPQLSVHFVVSCTYTNAMCPNVVTTDFSSSIWQW
jgi:hypothetical protein